MGKWITEKNSFNLGGDAHTVSAVVDDEFLACHVFEYP